MNRIEDPDLLRGRAHFVDDIHFPGMAEAAFVRSPHAHAAIHSIDCAAARAATGVHAVLTLADLRPYLRRERLAVGLPSPAYRQQRDRPVLADGEVVHVGEPVAIVVADSRYRAEDVAALVAVEYEPLPAVADCRAALVSDAPGAHRTAPHNLLAEFTMQYGDVERAFAGAPHSVALSLWQHRGGAHSIEGRGAVAYVDPADGRLTLWSSTQTPHAAHRLLCDLLGRPEHLVRVATPEVGGGFGPKLVFYPEDVATVLAAVHLRRPVKWIEDRREHFVATTQERDQYWEAELALDAEGRILGLRGTMIHDHGAYTARGVNLPYESAQTVTLPYDVPAYRLDVRLALTNKVPVTPVRGAGQPQGVFAMERLLDRAARTLGLDRAEIRRRNLIGPERMPCTKPLVARGGQSVVLDSGDYPKVQALALAEAGWAKFPARQERARAEQRFIGMGFANFVKGTGRGPFESARVRIGAAGDVHVASGAAAMGQGTKSMLAQVVAEILNMDPAKIAATTGDTAAIALGIGGFNSRQAVLAGSAAHRAAVAVRDKTLTLASHLLEAAPDDLEIAEDEVRVKAAPGMKLALADVARAAAGTAGFALPGGLAPGLEAADEFMADAMAYANGTAVAAVEVDPETGLVAVEQLVIAHDCGRIINPMIVDGQIEGGAVHGLGNALLEWMGFDDGAQPVTTSFAEYLLPSAAGLPRLSLLHHESPSPLNPLGVKGVGECGVMAVPAAIVAAIEDALSPFGVEIAQVPIRPHEIAALVSRSRSRS
ncbi:MAG TPA: xanthine dehydrogenase family protein molybdopterin-binding subunit [Stellaceae bacterium]|nr:xanthine dehydrogenase family protein molybdopterin-binding subunit [Stellaceae bacterium]